MTQLAADSTAGTIAEPLTFNGVGFDYPSSTGRIRAIEHLDGKIEAGRFVSVIGPSGCGKSTLLDIAAGLAQPTHGTVLAGDTAIRRPRRSTSIVFQEPALLPWRSILDNVAFPLEVARVRRRERRERAKQLIDLVGLSGFEDKVPANLSGGMRQRASIARALTTTPALLLMDEPFGALDQQTRAMMGIELTRAWEEVRCTVMFVTHDIAEAVSLSDEVWVLSRRPAVLKERVLIDLPRPRREDLPLDPEFQRLQGHLWSLLREESDAMHQGKQ